MEVTGKPLLITTVVAVLQTLVEEGAVQTTIVRLLVMMEALEL